MSRPLHGQVAVVTGAARGVGAELARQLSARGARVALLGLEPDGLAAVAAQCPGSLAVEVDVTDGAALDAAAARVLARYGRVDVLVCSAGIAAGGPMLLADAASYDRVVEVNLLGSVRTVRAFLPAVVASRGYVLQVASLAAVVPVPMMSAYCASKSGVEAFAHSLRGELRHHGVDVGVAYLSWTDTDMVRGADARLGLSGLHEALPGVLGRTWPLEPSVARLVRGVERRRAHVHGQAWLAPLRWLRALAPAVTARPPAGQARDTEARLRLAGPGATTAVGAGGEADTLAAARVVGGASRGGRQA